MSKTYLEVEFRQPPRAFFLEDTNHPWFIDQLAKLGWEVVVDPTDSFDLCLVSETGYEVEMYNLEYLVVFADNRGRFTRGEPYDGEEFELRFVTK